MHQGISRRFILLEKFASLELCIERALKGSTLEEFGRYWDRYVQLVELT